jgi:hypothetical protein
LEIPVAASYRLADAAQALAQTTGGHVGRPSSSRPDQPGKSPVDAHAPLRQIPRARAVATTPPGPASGAALPRPWRISLLYDTGYMAVLAFDALGLPGDPVRSSPTRGTATLHHLPSTAPTADYAIYRDPSRMRRPECHNFVTGRSIASKARDFPFLWLLARPRVLLPGREAVTSDRGRTRCTA